MTLPQTLDLDLESVVGVQPARPFLVRWFPSLRWWPLPTTWVVLGRDPVCDVVLDDPSISRRHARVRCAGESLVVEDLGSRNGVFVRGNRVACASVIDPATVLRIGRGLFSLRFITHDTTEGSGDGLFDARSDDRFASLGLVGGLAVRKVHTALRALAPIDEAVLILGETGTGKGLAAAALARLAGRQLHAVSGAELRPETALSALFGHVRGAFTGADRAHDGYVKTAGSDFLFLDEVADLPADVQSMLLRVLQDRRFRPLGGTSDLSATCRVIAATSIDLRARVESGRFRPDLFHRLDQRRIEMPPLRERIEDLPVLVTSILKRRHSIDIASGDLDPFVLERLATHAWPGNVRELENVVGKAYDPSAPGLLAPQVVQRVLEPPPATAPIEVRSPVGELGGAARVIPGPPKALFAPRRPSKIDRLDIEAAIRRAGGNRALAARLLGIGRATLYRHLRSRDTP
jgi:DNA-binding NtrC family response regulator